MTPPEVLGTVPQWITATGIVTIIVAYWRRGVALKGLANADIADIRQHLQEELARVIERQRQCEEREMVLRERLGKAEDEINLLKDRLRSYGIDKVLLLDERGLVEAPHSAAAAQRLKDNGK